MEIQIASADYHLLDLPPIGKDGTAGSERVSIVKNNRQVASLKLSFLVE